MRNVKEQLKATQQEVFNYLKAIRTHCDQILQCLQGCLAQEGKCNGLPMNVYRTQRGIGRKGYGLMKPMLSYLTVYPSVIDRHNTTAIKYEVETLWFGDVFAEGNRPKIKAKYYKMIEKLLSSARTLKMAYGWVFQHDNSLKHAARWCTRRSILRSWSSLVSCCVLTQWPSSRTNFLLTILHFR